MKKIKLYSDGACSGNPGKGGWASILIYGEHIKKLSGYVPHTTNNRMEMFGIISGLSALKESCSVEIYSDSSYVIDAFEKGWITKWQGNNWKTSDKKDVKNVDLWRDLLLKLSSHDYTFVKVKGHADDYYNNECDKLAVAAYKHANSDIYNDS